MKSRDIRKWLCFLVAMAIILSAVPALASETDSIPDTKEILVSVENVDGLDLGSFIIGIENFDPEQVKPIDITNELSAFGKRDIISGGTVDPRAKAATAVLSSLPEDSAAGLIGDALAKVAFYLVDIKGNPLQVEAEDGTITTAPTIFRDFKRGEVKTVADVIKGLPQGFSLLNGEEPIDTSKESNNQNVVLAVPETEEGTPQTMAIDPDGNFTDVLVESVADVNLMAIEMAPKQIAKVKDAKDVVIKQESEINFDVYDADEIDILLASFTPEQRVEIENSEHVTVKQLMNIYFNMYLKDQEVIVKDIDVFVPVKKVATTIPKTADTTSMMSLVALMVSGLGMVTLKKKIK